MNLLLCDDFEEAGGGRCVGHDFLSSPVGCWINMFEENRLSLELQRGLAGLGEAQNSGGCINAAHATLSLKSQRD